jgi:hypothetical protein
MRSFIAHIMKLSVLIFLSYASRIAMDADENVGFVAVGNCGAFVQFDKNIGCARVNNFDVRVILLNIFSKLQGNGQRNIFFFHKITMASGIFSAMTGINTNHFYLLAFRPDYC